jgi:hypothetical protein
MHGSWTILAHRIIYRRVKDSPIVPDGNVTFLHWRHHDVLWFQDTQLDVSEEFADCDHILDDLRVFGRA